MIHGMRMKPGVFDRLLSGSKKAIIFDNEIDAQLGDRLSFLVADKEIAHTYNDHIFGITHISVGHGLQHGYVCASVEFLSVHRTVR